MSEQASAIPPKGKKKAGKPLSPRQEKFVKGLAAGKTQVQAGLDAGYKNIASGWQVLKTIRQGFYAAADRRGITPDAFIEKYVVPGMEATAVPRGLSGGMWVELMEPDPSGELLENGRRKLRPVQEPDWQTRHKFDLLFAKLMGAMREEVDLEVQHTFTLNLESASDDQLKAILRATARASQGGRGTAGPGGNGRVVQALPDSVAPGG